MATTMEPQELLTLIKCEPSFSFKYAVTRALNPTPDDPELVTEELISQSKKYEWEPSFEKFERVNNVALIVMGDGGSLYLSKARTLRNPQGVARLYFDKKEKRFSVINNMREFLSSEICLLHLSESKATYDL